MRRLATLGEYEEISYGQVLAMMWLGHISFTEFMAFSNERIFLVRRARERSIGV